MRSAADERDLLALLRVDESAAWNDVRRAFREAVRANHPDLHPGDAGVETVLGCRQLESLRFSLFAPKRSLVLERLDNRRFA